jgi:hypothetical protein
MNNPDNPVIKSGGTITFTPSKKLTSNLKWISSQKILVEKKKHQKIWRIFVDITSQPLRALSCHPMRRPK